MNILLFGQLADLAGAKTLDIAFLSDTDELIRHMELLYPSLRGLPYLLAVNRNIIQSTTMLTADAEIALLPPYSGG